MCHKASMAVASVAQAHGAEVISLGTIGTRQCASDTLLRQLRSKSTPRVGVYAAGPCSSWLSRSLLQHGDVCGGVAPSLMPQKAGDRVTTDRRDAMHLARLMRSGALTPVDVPAVDDAAIRDLSRAREATLRELQAAKLRLTAFWLRPASRSTGRAHWSPAPLRWRSAVVCPTPAPHMVFSIRPDRHGTDGTSGPSGTRTPGASADLALGPRGRGPPGAAGWPVPRRRDHGGRTGRPEARRYSPTPHACAGAHPLGIGQGGTSSAGPHDHNWAYPCASCLGRRCLGRPGPSHSPSASATASGEAPHRAPGPQLAGPRMALHTGAPAAGAREQGPAGRRRHGPSMQGLPGGHGPAGSRATASRKRAAW